MMQGNARQHPDHEVEQRALVEPGEPGESSQLGERGEPCDLSGSVYHLPLVAPISPIELLSFRYQIPMRPLLPSPMLAFAQSDAISAEVAGQVAELAIVFTVLAAYAVFQAIWLIVRVAVRYPHNRALRLVGGLWVAAVGLLGLAAVLQVDGVVLGTLGTLAGIATIALVIAARIIELYFDDRFQRERSRETLIEDVLSRPWWEPAA